VVGVAPCGYPLLGQAQGLAPTTKQLFWKTAFYNNSCNIKRLQIV